MKKIYTSVILLLLCAGAFSQTSTYQGNGNYGFNGTAGQGPVGSGTLTINYDGTNLNFTLVTPNSNGVNLGGNVFAIYIDNGMGGGFDSTSLFTDQTPGTKSVADAIAGVYGTNRSNLIFPIGFAPQYGLGISASSSGDNPTTLLTKLANGGPFTTIALPVLTDTGSVYYKVSITPAQIGLSGVSFGFHFMGTLTSSDGYRSNEAIGMNVGGALAGGANIGYNSYTDTTASLAFTVGSFAITFGSFNGTITNNKASLLWNTKNESNLSQFDVEKSIDGITFNTIGSVNAKNNNSGSQYNFADNNATAGNNYYRLKMNNKDASFTYSAVLLLNSNSGHKITLFGNPVKSVINLNISDDNASVYHLNLYSADGKALATQIFNHPGGTSNVAMHLPSAAKGMCLLKVSNGTNIETFHILVQQ